jgi:transposase
MPIPASHPWRPKDQEGFHWMLLLAQGQIRHDDATALFAERLSSGDIAVLLDTIQNKPIRYRNRALAYFAFLHGIPLPTIAAFLCISPTSAYSYIDIGRNKGIDALLNPFANRRRKITEKQYVDSVFAILHAPPSTYGFNRTTWRLEDIKTVMAHKGLPLSKNNISRIIRQAGYRYRKAKKVLTSTDPDYRTKLQKITRILSRLGPREKFFSIDEFGPFAVKIQGGRSLMPKGHARTVPQLQKSKGSLIITGALELSTNQIVHFYSKKKNTCEMLKLLEILVKQYANEDRIYFSWDAASWHASREFYQRVAALNKVAKTNKGHGPVVKLAPLPSCAQFLNVIESVFSGMARAVIHNSDYQSVKACKLAINRHFATRNRFFRANPKRAGNKIWGHERVTPEFRESNNCKDPRYSN